MHYDVIQFYKETTLDKIMPATAATLQIPIKQPVTRKLHEKITGCL